MRFTFLLGSLLLLRAASAQPDFTWSQDLDLPYTDPAGRPLTGTEVIHLVAHKGALWAGNSYWNETTAPRRGQIWHKPAHNGPWMRDYEMPPKHSRVPSLYSFAFARNAAGLPVPPDTILFAAATYDKGPNAPGPAVVFMRHDATATWVKHDLGLTSHAFDYTQVRSMGFHRDAITGADIVFAGANPAPTGVYAGRYDPTAPGHVSWDPNPEFIPAGYQRIMGFAVCRDTLYMATQREVYKRLDGPAPQWVQVLDLAAPAIINTYGSGIDPYWIADEDIRAFRTLPAPDGSGPLLAFGALNHIFRLAPHQGYALTPEQDLELVLEASTGADIHYIQTQLMTDYTEPTTGETLQLIGIEAFYDTAYIATHPQPNLGGFNQQGWYLIRRATPGGVQYLHREIADWSIAPQPDSLARVRSLCPSPFAADSGRVVYAGGFAPWFIGGVTNTAWVYRGTLQQPAASPHHTLHPNISYGPAQPAAQNTLDIYTPNTGSGPHPVLVYVHGGGWRQGDKAAVSFKADFFTQTGYVFVSVNYRLSPDPIDLADTARVKFPTHPQDVAAALAWVHAHIASYGGDPAQISIMGHSAGAHLASLVATDGSYLQAHNLPLSTLRCACSLDAGGHDIPYYLNTYQVPGDSQWNLYQNAFGSDPAIWAQASPYTHVSASAGIPPFMLVHQGTAQRVDLHQRFGSQLAAHGIPVTYLNAAPLDHEGINAALGNPAPATAPYNDSVAQFLAHCLGHATQAAPQATAPEIHLWPNPTTDHLTITLSPPPASPGAHAELRDATGRPLLHIPLQSPQTRLNLRPLPAGLYTLHIHGTHPPTIHRILKH